MFVCVCVYLDENSRVCEGVIEHGQHVRCGDDTGVVTPGSDQQPVIDLEKEKSVKQWTPPQSLITETMGSTSSSGSSSLNIMNIKKKYQE